MKIRQYDAVTDADQLRECVIELQDFERTLDPRMPSGEVIEIAMEACMMEIVPRLAKRL